MGSERLILEDAPHARGEVVSAVRGRGGSEEVTGLREQRGMWPGSSTTAAPAACLFQLRLWPEDHDPPRVTHPLPRTEHLWILAAPRLCQGPLPLFPLLRLCGCPPHPGCCCCRPHLPKRNKDPTTPSSAFQVFSGLFLREVGLWHSLADPKGPEPHQHCTPHPTCTAQPKKRKVCL